MHEVRAKIDRFTPIVVDDELAAMGRRNSRLAHLGLDRLRLDVLDAKLDEFAPWPRCGRPRRRRKHGIERIELGALKTRSILKNGVPATGVDGDAITRLDRPCLDRVARPRLRGRRLAPSSPDRRTCHRRVQQHGVIAELHRFRSLRRRAGTRRR